MIQVQLIPDGLFHNKDLQILLQELHKITQAKEVMHRKEAAAFLGISTRQLDYLTSDSALPYHNIEGLKGRLFLRSELIEFIKKS